MSQVSEFGASRLGSRRAAFSVSLASAIAFFTLWSIAHADPIPVGLEELNTARAQLVAHYDDVVRRMGAEQAADLEQRLDDDIGAYLSGETPDNFSKADWIQRLNGLGTLDSNIVTQVVSGKPEPIEGSRGLVERLILARSDHTLEPFALYVPSSLSSNPALVVLLHGRPQTESEILVGPYFQRLADSTGTIVAAPYGRGIYDYAPPADDEVYQVAQAVASAFGIDAHRVYLVGYSMGGFSVFKIGPEHPTQWVAVMSIAGSVLNSEAQAVLSGFARTRMYIVNGAKDENIPPQYGVQTAQWLAGVGIPTGLYQEPNGTHYLSTLMPSLSRAWHEMLAGFIGLNAQPVIDSRARLPQLAPSTGNIQP